ncbi:excisionase [Streptococcus sp. H31]|uniref:excisionase n=1 Tax=Streptococcus huangxiaojuni TaxID=3237239 RepID=UPI0034A5B430
MKEDINNFPDKMVNKTELIENYFPYFKIATLNKYLLLVSKNEKFKNILLRPSTRMTMINVKGFYLYLRWCEENKFK